MATSLQDIVFTEANWSPLVADVQSLVDQEIANKSGVSATGLKLAYKAVNAFAPGYYQQAVGAILPGVGERLEPFWADFTASGGSSFGDYLSKRGGEVAESLLTVTDDMAERSDRGAVVKAYKSVRGGASKHIEAALPNLGALVQKYAG
jgi:uncharacterized protein DUF6918